MTRAELENLLKLVLCDKDIHHNIGIRRPDDTFFMKDCIRHTIIALHKEGKLK